ncbi:MAG: GMP reductase [Pirellulaceae bacterium]|jgi:GMP reductase|nr:GMP reductase [Pirellulaceae bacterium]
MRIDNDPKLDFDDVLIRPKRSEAPSRSAVDLEREYRFLNSGHIWRGIPLVASNMDTIGTLEMALALGPQLLTCLHKHHTEEQLIPFLDECVRRDHLFVTIGIRDEDFDQLARLVLQAEVRYVCVDAANGYTKFFVDRVKRVRDTFPGLTIMAGNVATPEMVQELLISGAADIVKIGIGPGSVCATRTKTGVGYPQLSAIIECADAAHGLRGHVCADGGCRVPGDVVKAFAAGADFVMLGGMLAGHDECAGDWIEQDGRRVGMPFYGMASRTAMERYAGGVKDYRACEGHEVVVPYRGPVKDTIREILGGVRSACAYVGAGELKDLCKCTTFVLCHRTHNTVFGP